LMAYSGMAKVALRTLELTLEDLDR
jgi:hypothetical protein